MVNKLVQREKMQEIQPCLEDEEIIIILGARRVGKTTLLTQIKAFLIQEKAVQENDIYFLNLDVIDDFAIVKDQSAFIAYVKARMQEKRKIYFFIDEVQRIENPGLFLKGVYDLNLNVKFIVSGSSSLEIKTKTQEPLTGRKRLFYLYPFSFEEFLALKNKQLLRMKMGGSISPPDKKLLRAHFKEFMVWGGYPEVCLETNEERKIKALEEIFNSYLDKDIVNFLKIEDGLAFNKLVKLFASQIGNLVNVRELSTTVGIKNETVARYIRALEGTFVLQMISPFFKNARKEITKMPKVYFIDTGLRNFALKRFETYDLREDAGPLLENYVFSALIKHLNTFDTVFFWRTKDKAEIDFIVERKDLLPIEVKAHILKKPIFPRQVMSFAKKYAVKNALLVNLSYEGVAEKDGLRIQYAVPEDLTNNIKTV